MSRMFILTIAICWLIPVLTVADTQIGGDYHEQALQAWKEFNKGMELPEERLKALLLSNNSSERVRYYELACDKGAAGFCTMAGYEHEKNPLRAIKYFSKGCEIAHDGNNCLPAMSDFLKVGKIKDAGTMFKLTCNGDDLPCDYWDFKEKHYKEMLLQNCSEGHATSCSILDSHNVKYKTQKSVSEEVAKLNKHREEKSALERGWDGNFETANCKTADDCRQKSNQHESYFGEFISYAAKACSLGGATCLGVGEYEENRGREDEAFKWYLLGCNKHPESKGLCFVAIESALKLKRKDQAEVLLRSTCIDDSDYCENVLTGSEGKAKFGTLVKQACKNGNKQVCQFK